MKRPLAFATLLAAVALLAACGSFQSSLFPQEGGSSSSEEVLDPVPPEEVTYQGTVEALAASSVPEATHRLSLGEGLYLFLRSDNVSLDEYVDLEVRVKGVVRPTVEGDADLMRVSYVEAILLESSSSESESSASEESSSEASSLSSVVSSPRSSSLSSPPTRSVAASSATPDAGVESSSAATTEQEKAMAKASTDAGLWTQRYCSSHIGFCIPVHKSWWYKSFGATASSLWHVELSAQEIENMGEGVITVEFLSGAVPAGSADGAVQDSDGTVTGYRAWTNGRHFRVTGPSSVRASVQYITQNITTYDVTAE